MTILTECPACGYEFDPEERRHVHLSEHGPEDFGLSPLGEIEENHQQPLFEDVSSLPRLASDGGSNHERTDNRGSSE